MYGNYFKNPITPEQKIALVIIGVWTLFWKGLALWRAAKKDKKNWFIALLIINTVGILEIIYLLFFNNRDLADLFKKTSKKKGNKK